MSDTTTPAAPAPTTDTPAQPGGETKPATPAAPPDPKAELGAMLKKLGGLKVKAAGKEHVIDSVEKLERYAQRGIPVDQSYEELAKVRAEVEPVKELFAKLRSGSEDEVEAALEQLLDRGVIDKVAERRLRRQYEREQQMEGLSERERALARALEQERNEKSRLAAEQKRLAEQQQRAQEEQQVQAIKGYIGDVITKSLETMGLPPKLEPLAGNFMKPIISAALRAGMPLDPAVLAEKVSPLFDEMLQYRTKSLEGEALLKFLGGGEVSKKFRAALLAQLSASKPGAGTPVETKPAAAPAREVWDPRKPLL